ncbi:glycosyltransferase, partial [Pseudomonas urethralis]|uniref:glycosyltransferase n=1 Tax=Pseudomonas urethralis TaxID=2740517 RepID=UPI001596CE37
NMPAGVHQQVGAGHQPGNFLRRAEMVDDGDVPGHAGDQDTFGLVILEAMASATPVVAVRAGAFGEIVNETSGRLCPANDGRAMA